MSPKKPKNTEKSPAKTRSKRLLSPEISANKPQENKEKRKKVHKMTSADVSELKKLLASVQNGIESKIITSQNTIENKLNDLSNKVDFEVQTLKTSVEEFQNNIGSNINSIYAKLNSHEQRLDNTEDDIQRLRYACDLRLTGIPHIHNENLLNIYNTLASIIGFDNSNTAITPILERLPIRNRATGLMIASPTILIHFSTIQLKNWFYSLYLNKMPLKGEAFGLQIGKNVILGVNLTPKNASIFKTAKQLKSSNKLAQVYTQDGLIKIRFVRGPNQKTHTVRSIIELNYLVEQQNQIGMEIESNTIQTTLHSQVQPRAQETLNPTTNTPATNRAHALSHLKHSGQTNQSNGASSSDNSQHTGMQQQTTNETATQPTHTPNQLNNQTRGASSTSSTSQRPNTTHNQSTAHQQQPATT